MCATFLYIAAMMAVRTRIPTRKHLWKYWCRISDWMSALTNMRTARMYPRYCGICLSFVKCIKALKQINLWLFPPTETDSDSDSDSGPNGYIVLNGNFSTAQTPM